MPILPFRAPQGIRMVAIDRNSGQRVFGAFDRRLDRFDRAIEDIFVSPSRRSSRAI